MRRLGTATEGCPGEFAANPRGLVGGAPKLDEWKRVEKGLFVRCGIPSPLGFGGRVLDPTELRGQLILTCRRRVLIAAGTRHRGSSWRSFELERWWGWDDPLPSCHFMFAACLTDARRHLRKTQWSVTGRERRERVGAGWIGRGSYQGVGEVWTG